MAADRPSHSTLSRVVRERLPFPLGLYWLRAQQARTPMDAFGALEGALSAITALLLAEAVHAPDLKKLDGLLRGGETGRALERPTLGRRLELLHHTVSVVASLPDPLLVGVEGWWATLNEGRSPLLQGQVQARNHVGHGTGLLPANEQDRIRCAAVSALTLTLSTARFLRSVQLVHLEGSTRVQGGRQWGQLRRLSGSTPYLELALDAAWPLDAPFEHERVYLSDAAGTRWLLQPFLHLDLNRREAATRVSVLHAIDRRGRLVFSDPLRAEPVQGAVPGADWQPITVRALLETRAQTTAGWRFSLSPTPAAFAFPEPQVLSDGLEPGMRLDQFRMVERVGEGGAAVVWAVEDEDDGARYALKVLSARLAEDEIAVRRFEDEVRTLKRLARAGCSRVIGPVEAFRVADGDGRRVVLRMPMYESNLRQHVAELRSLSPLGAVPEETVVRWLDQALEALAQLHAQGVVHRDIKPSNFLVDAEGDLFVADLGVALREDRTDRRTRTGMVLGTEAYMAPEQRVGSREVGPAADLYALAVSIDELLHGEVRVVPGKGVGGVVGALLRAMSASDPEDRPGAAAARAQLAPLLVPPEPAAPPASAEPPAFAEAPASAEPPAPVAPPIPAEASAAAASPVPAASPSGGGRWLARVTDLALAAMVLYRLVDIGVLLTGWVGWRTARYQVFGPLVPGWPGAEATAAVLSGVPPSSALLGFLVVSSLLAPLVVRLGGTQTRRWLWLLLGLWSAADALAAGALYTLGGPSCPAPTDACFVTTLHFWTRSFTDLKPPVMFGLVGVRGLVVAVLAAVVWRNAEAYEGHQSRELR